MEKLYFVVRYLDQATGKWVQYSKAPVLWKDARDEVLGAHIEHAIDVGNNSVLNDVCEDWLCPTTNPRWYRYYGASKRIQMAAVGFA